jgi:hypothetical protein
MPVLTPFQIKVDVNNELRYEMYLNQLEVERLVNNPQTYSHRLILKKISSLLKKNVSLDNATKLLDIYLPDKNVNPDYNNISTNIPTKPELGIN